MTGNRKPVNVFLSYAYEDAWLARSLEAHLKILQREGLISTWCQRQILAGADWAGVVDQHIEQALLILLLVSTSLLASDYCTQSEVRKALARHQAGKAAVIPIIGRPSDWKHAPFAHLQQLPSNGKAITGWGNRDSAFVNVATGIRAVVESLASRTADPAYKPWPASSDNPILASGAPDTGQPGARGKTADKSPVLPTTTTRERPAPRESRARGHRARFGAPFPPIWTVPRRHSLSFTGRELVLDQLFDAFSIENNVGTISPQALTGLGGMGKTQVATEYAYYFRADYQAVLWANAESEKSLLASFKSLARELKLPESQINSRASLLQNMRNWFRDQSDWLLILNNADHPGVADPFLPSAARGHLLVTTRAAAGVQWGRSHKLNALSTEDGALCLLLRAGLLDEGQQLTDAPPHRVEAALELAQLMDGLPLALEQAGAYINDTECGVVSYLELYKKYRREIRIVQVGWVHDYPVSVAFAWQTSRNSVEQDRPAAAELLRLCAFLAPDGIPDELILAGSDALGPLLAPETKNPHSLNMLIKTLRGHSLINREVDRETDLPRLYIHRVMQEIIIDEMNQDEQRLWAERTVRAVYRASASVPEEQLLAHARQCQLWIAKWQMAFPEASALLRWLEKMEQQGEK